MRELRALSDNQKDVTRGAHSSWWPLHCHSVECLSGEGEDESHPVEVPWEETGEGLVARSRGHIQAENSVQHPGSLAPEQPGPPAVWFPTTEATLLLLTLCFLLRVSYSISPGKRSRGKGFVVPAKSWQLEYMVNSEDSRIGSRVVTATSRIPEMATVLRALFQNH